MYRTIHTNVFGSSKFIVHHFNFSFNIAASFVSVILSKLSSFLSNDKPAILLKYTLSFIELYGSLFSFLEMTCIILICIPSVLLKAIYLFWNFVDVDDVEVSLITTTTDPLGAWHLPNFHSSVSSLALCIKVFFALQQSNNILDLELQNSFDFYRIFWAS